MPGLSMSATIRQEEDAILASPRRAALLSAVVVTLTAVVFVLVAVHSTLARIQRIDNGWLRLMVSGRTPLMTAIAKVFNVLGLVYVTLPVRIALAGFLALKRRWWHLAAFTAAVVTSELLIGSLKDVYDRSRPFGSLVATSGWVIVLVGLFSILCGLAYTGGPWPVGYHGLGDLFVFVFFGLVAVIGSAFVQVGVVSPLAVAASIPVGLLVTAILIVNNLRDIETDRLAGKHTLAVRLGERFTRIEYAAFLIVPFVVPIALRLAGLVGSWFWLPILSLPLAILLVRLVTRTSDATVLNRSLKQTGQLHLLFGLLFAASLVV